MLWAIEFLLFLILIVSAVVALGIRNLLAAVVTLTIFSYMSALIMISLGALDVGFTEAVVGAGVVGIFNVIAIFKTSRKSCD
ncbi:MAG: hydrogenase subunit MbhD domain-containing protein [Desulfonatronovibrionaceae bacterium]